MKRFAKRFFSLLLSISILLTMSMPSFAETVANDSMEKQVPEFKDLKDPALLKYMVDEVYAGLADRLKSEDYIINNVETVYVSKEYLEEMEYNSLDNIWFGYSLPELIEQFEGEKFVFTLGEDMETTVVPFQDYDDVYDRVIRNVMIGSGVILMCVTVSVVTGGAGLAPVSMIFVASAKTGAVMALEAGTFSAVAAGAITGIKTGDFDEALKAGALAGSNSFKWGAIGGAISGGVSESLLLKYIPDDPVDIPFNPDDTVDPALWDDYLDSLDVPDWRISEIRAQHIYGGEDQVCFLDGEQVAYGTAGSTRPDLARMIDDHWEFIEVKNYNLESPSSLSGLYNVLENEISARVLNLPENATQRIVLDVTERGFSEELVQDVAETIGERLFDIYPNIPVDIIGL